MAEWRTQVLEDVPANQVVTVTETKSGPQFAVTGAWRAGCASVHTTTPNDRFSTSANASVSAR